MTTISRLAIKFEADGVDQVVKGNQRIEKSVSKMGKRAKAEEKNVKNWMQRHQMALVGIGAVATAMMYGIIRASPSMTASLDSTRMAFSFLAMQIGEHVAPMMELVENFAWKIAEGFESLPSPVQKAVSVIVVALGGLGIALASVTLLSKLFAGATAFSTTVALIKAGALKILTVAQWLYNTALYGCPLVWIIALIVGLIAVIYYLEKRFGIVTKFVNWFSDALGVAWEYLQKAFNWIRDVGSKILSAFGDLFKRVFETIETIVATVLLTIYYLFTGQFGKLSELWSKFGERMREIWGDLWDRILNALRNFGSRIVDGLKNLLKQFWDLLWYVIDPRNWQEIAENLTKKGWEMVQSILKGIGNIGLRIWNWIKEKMVNFTKNIVAWAEGKMGMSPTLIQIGIKIVQALIKGIGNIGKKLWDAVVGGLSSFTGKITDWGKNALKWGSDMINNFSSGIKNASKKLEDTAKGTFDKVRSVFSFDIRVNDKTLQTWGADFIDNWSMGVDRNVGRLEQAVGNAMQSAQIMAQPIAQPQPMAMAPQQQNGGNGQRINITIEAGAIQIMPTELDYLDERVLSDMIAERIEESYRGRS